MDLSYVPGALVEVRSGAPTYWPGVVASVDETKIVVTLDQPVPTAAQWSGARIRYGPDLPVTSVTIWKASEAALPDGRGHIRPRVIDPPGPPLENV